jgi:hypothetical protein
MSAGLATMSGGSVEAGRALGGIPSWGSKKRRRMTAIHQVGGRRVVNPRRPYMLKMISDGRKRKALTPAAVSPNCLQAGNETPLARILGRLGRESKSTEVEKVVGRSSSAAGGGKPGSVAVGARELSDVAVDGGEEFVMIAPEEGRMHKGSFSPEKE